MPITPKNDGHQFSSVGYIDLTPANLPATGVYTRVFDLPANAVFIEGGLKVVEAFNPGTSLTVSCGTPATPVIFLGPTTLTAVAAVPLVVQNTMSAGATKVGITLALVGAAPTAGRAVIYIRYLVLGKAHEAVG